VLACQGQITQERLFATLFLARFDPRTLRLAYTNAGHRHPFVFRGPGAPVRLVQGGTVLGMLETLPFEEGTMTLEPGDRVVLYTDGATEAMNPSGELFGEERLCAAAIAASRANSSPQAVTEILARIGQFQAGRHADDDIVVMALQVPARGA
jgi:serine phosphatase RsbU (regulator of sigma subunit)